MKLERLLAITVHLLHHEVVSAGVLARRFEVSPRTIQRDMAALSLAGIPVASVPGVHGGYQILDPFRLGRQPYTAQDAAWILAALKSLNSGYPNQRLEATLEKLLNAAHAAPLPEQTVFVDLSVSRESQPVQSALRRLEEAIRSRQAVTFAYTDAAQRVTQRRAEPVALTYQWYAWYVLAYCLDRQAYRLFKLSRVSQLENTRQPFTQAHRPAAELLAEQERADQRPTFEIRLACRAETRAAVLEYFNGVIETELPNGEFIYHLRAPQNERLWFSLLLGFGESVRVLEPAEVGQRLRETAQGIVNQYSQ